MEVMKAVAKDGAVTSSEDIGTSYANAKCEANAHARDLAHKLSKQLLSGATLVTPMLL